MNNKFACEYIGSGKCSDNNQLEGREEIAKGVSLKDLRNQYQKVCERNGHDCITKKNFELLTGLGGLPL